MRIYRHASSSARGTDFDNGQPPISIHRFLGGGAIARAQFKMRRVVTMCLASAAASIVVAISPAATSGPPDIAHSYLFTPGGKLTPLKAHTTYEGRLFPIALRITPPIAGWSGAQWKSGTVYFHGGGPPNFGWVHLGRGTTGVPQGLITVMTAYARTPSVAATVNVLRIRGRGATYDPTIPIDLAGFSGVQFDGKITGSKNFDHIGHYFIPFSPKSSSAKYYPDEYGVYGDVFRVIVLDVRGKTVIVYIEHPVASRFPAFLAQADKILKSLRFPKP